MAEVIFREDVEISIPDAAVAYAERELQRENHEHIMKSGGLSKREMKRVEIALRSYKKDIKKILENGSAYPTELYKGLQNSKYDLFSFFDGRMSTEVVTYTIKSMVKSREIKFDPDSAKYELQNFKGNQA